MEREDESVDGAGAVDDAVGEEERESDVASMLLQSLGLILQRENARAILRRWPTTNADRSIAASRAAIMSSASLRSQSHFTSQK